MTRKAGWPAYGDPVGDGQPSRLSHSDQYDIRLPERVGHPCKAYVILEYCTFDTERVILHASQSRSLESSQTLHSMNINSALQYAELKVLSCCQPHHFNWKENSETSPDGVGTPCFPLLPLIALPGRLFLLCLVLLPLARSTSAS